MFPKIFLFIIHSAYSVEIIFNYFISRVESSSKKEETSDFEDDNKTSTHTRNSSNNDNDFNKPTPSYENNKSVFKFCPPPDQKSAFLFEQPKNNSTCRSHSFLASSTTKRSDSSPFNFLNGNNSNSVNNTTTSEQNKVQQTKPTLFEFGKKSDTVFHFDFGSDEVGSKKAISGTSTTRKQSTGGGFDTDTRETDCANGKESGGGVDTENIDTHETNCASGKESEKINRSVHLLQEEVESLKIEIKDMKDGILEQLFVQNKLQKIKFLQKRVHKNTNFIGDFGYYRICSETNRILSSSSHQSKALVHEILYYFALDLGYELKYFGKPCHDCNTNDYYEIKSIFVDRIKQQLTLLMGHSPRIVETNDTITMYYK